MLDNKYFNWTLLKNIIKKFNLPYPKKKKGFSVPFFFVFFSRTKHVRTYEKQIIINNKRI